MQLSVNTTFMDLNQTLQIDLNTSCITSIPRGNFTCTFMYTL